MNIAAAKQLKYGLTLLVLAVFGYFLYKFHDDLLIVGQISAGQFLLMLALSLLTIHLTGMKLLAVSRFFGIHLSLKEWFGLAAMLLSLNGLLFKSGTLLVSNYLKRVYAFPYMSYVGTLGADLIITLFISAWTGLTVTGYLQWTTGTDFKLFHAGFVALILILFLLMRNNIHLEEKGHRILDAAARAVKALNNLFRSKGLLGTLSGIAVGIITVTALRFYVSASILHFEIPVTHCLLFTITITFIRNIPLIQNDMGTRELAVGLLSELLGDGLKQGFLITVVDRVFVLLWCLVAAGLLRDILLNKPAPAGTA